MQIDDLINKVLEINFKQNERLQAISENLAVLVNRMEFFTKSGEKMLRDMDRLERRVAHLERDAIRVKMAWGIIAAVISTVVSYLIHHFA